jgi:Cyanobacterial and plant NDH-1 subunit O
MKQSTNFRGELMAVKKGDIVRAIREKLENSLEAKASDTRFPSYLFETQGEIVDVKGDYALIKFGKVPTPNIWLRLDQLEEFKS